VAQAPDRDTGLPYSPYRQDQDTLLRGVQSTGPRTDTGSASSTERAQQSVNSYQSALNTTPTALAALDAVIGQLLGTPAQEAISEQQAMMQIPDLERVVRPSRISASGPGGFMFGADTSPAYVYYVDPKTGKQYSEAQGQTINTQRAQERKKVVTQGAVAATPGGTPEIRQQQEQRQQEIVRNRAAQESYSKEAAFGDAQSLVSKSIADALEAALPQISRASEGAGTSRSSMAALLAQRAGERGASEGAALGAQLGVQYGGLQNQLAQTLEVLTRADPNSPTALLLQAIIGSKGLVSEQSGFQESEGQTNKTTDQTTNVGPQDVYNMQLKNILEPLNTSLNTLTAQAMPEANPITRTPSYSMIASGSDADQGIVGTETESSIY
jgi:hypothetical protein